MWVLGACWEIKYTEIETFEFQSRQISLIHLDKPMKGNKKYDFGKCNREKSFIAFNQKFPS